MRHDSMSRRQAMSRLRCPTSGLGRDSRSERGMRSFSVVVRDPLGQHLPEMPLVKRNHPIERLAPGGSNEPFAVCVGLRSAHGRPQHLQRHRMNCVVHGRREDAIAIVYEEPIGGIQRKTIPKLDRPSGRGVFGDIPVHHSARRDVEKDKNVQPLKRGGHYQEEVAREHGTRMIVEE